MLEPLRGVLESAALSSASSSGARQDAHPSPDAVNLSKGTQAMEFVELLLLCVAVLLLIFKPEQEKLAWWLTIGGWAVVVFMYVGHVSTAILGQLNL